MMAGILQNHAKRDIKVWSRKKQVTDAVFTISLVRKTSAG
jgi:hypothetical protein